MLIEIPVAEMLNYICSTRCSNINATTNMLHTSRYVNSNYTVYETPATISNTGNTISAVIGAFSIILLSRV